MVWENRDIHGFLGSSWVLSTLAPRIRLFVENFVGLGFLHCFLYKTRIPTHEKIFSVGKSGPNATFLPDFSWVRLALGWGVRRFHTSFCMFSNPK